MGVPGARGKKTECNSDPEQDTDRHRARLDELRKQDDRSYSKTKMRWVANSQRAVRAKA